AQWKFGHLVSAMPGIGRPRRGTRRAGGREKTVKRDAVARHAVLENAQRLLDPQGQSRVLGRLLFGPLGKRPSTGLRKREPRKIPKAGPPLLRAASPEQKSAAAADHHHDFVDRFDRGSASRGRDLVFHPRKPRLAV